ncbi:MAG: cyclic nucleotide-binding domain-containing protein [Thermodesulfobacteriota bacterium]|nr:cyclic nucleotide-binding domain-containing protein [Thermodesulfobacteriota bacterium]
MNSEDFLKQVPLFHSLRPEDMRLLSTSVRTQSVKKGGALFYQGSEGTALCIIKKGSIKIVLPSLKFRYTDLGKNSIFKRDFLDTFHLNR